jgi:L-amino acid N-acyltransferase YncA
MSVDATDLMARPTKPTSMALTLRPAHPSDLASITDIYGHAVQHGTASFELDPPDLAEMTARFKTIAGAGYPYLVADDGTTVLGYAYANAYRPRPAYRFSVENSIYVAPQAQRRGVGQLLLLALIDACTALGHRQMIAVIGDSGQQASISLHRQNGFTLCGTIQAVGYKHGRWLDTVIMQRALGPGDTTAPF